MSVQNAVPYNPQKAQSLRKFFRENSIDFNTPLPDHMGNCLMSTIVHLATGSCWCSGIESMSALDYMIKASSNEYWELRCSCCSAADLLEKLLFNKNVERDELLTYMSYMDICKCRPQWTDECSLLCVYNILTKAIKKQDSGIFTVTSETTAAVCQVLA